MCKNIRRNNNLKNVGIEYVLNWGCFFTFYLGTYRRQECVRLHACGRSVRKRTEKGTFKNVGIGYVLRPNVSRWGCLLYVIPVYIWRPDVGPVACMRTFFPRTYRKRLMLGRCVDRCFSTNSI